MLIRIVLGLILVGAASVYAQTDVLVGIVGVSRYAQTNSYSIAAMQYNTGGTNTPESIYGNSLPLGSRVYKWSASGYDISEYNNSFDLDLMAFVEKWDTEFYFGRGEGYWVECPCDISIYLSGEVPVDAATTNVIDEGFQICAYPYPVDCAVTNMGFSPSLGDTVYVWNGSYYDISEYNNSFDLDLMSFVEKWDNEALMVRVGQGFWYESTISTNWIVQCPYGVE